MSEWISPAACHADQAAAEVPGLGGLVLARREERDQARAARTRRGPRAAGPDSEIPSSSRIEPASSSSSSRQLGLEPRGDRHRRGVAARRVLGHHGRNCVVALGHVRHVEHRLGGQRAEVARGVRRVVGDRHRAHRPPGLERLDHRDQPLLLRHRRTVARARLAHDPRVPALGLLEVGVDQLGLDRVHVRGRVDAPLRVDHVRVVVHAHHVQQRVGLADVGQELVAEPLALVRARHQPGDVVELDRVRHHVRGAARPARPRSSARPRPPRPRRSARSS